MKYLAQVITDTISVPPDWAAFLHGGYATLTSSTHLTCLSYGQSPPKLNDEARPTNAAMAIKNFIYCLI